MHLPKIDIGSLPELDHSVAMFGNATDQHTFCCDDTVIIIMVYVYDAFPPS